MALVAGGGAPKDAFDADLERLRAWWTKGHSGDRPDPAMAPSTIAGHVARLQQMRRWYEAARGTTLRTLHDLVLVHDTLTGYLDARAESGLGAGTRARDCSAFLCALKFAHAGYDPAAPPASFGVVRRIHNGLQKAFETDLRGRSDRQALAKANRWASWAEITSAATHVFDEFASLQRVLSRAKRGHDVDYTPAGAGVDAGLTEQRRRVAEAAQQALMCALYVKLPPGRCRELAGLLWAKSNSEQPSDDRRNLLVIDPTTGAASLRLGGFKTSKQTGVQCLDLPRDDFDPYVAAVLEHRAVLLRGGSHGFVFCRVTDGAPLTASGVWSSWVIAVFGRALEATHVRALGEDEGAYSPPRISVNVLRKAFVTQVHGADTTLQQRDSVAAAMRHQPKTAAQVYNAATSADRVAAGITLCGQMFSMGAAAGAAGATAAVQAALGAGAGSGGGEQVLRLRPQRPQRVDLDDDEEEGDDGATESEEDGEEDDELHALHKLLAQRRRSGHVEYLVQWSAPGSTPTWEDEGGLPPSAIREFYDAAVAQRQRQLKVQRAADGGGAAGAKRPRGAE